MYQTVTYLFFSQGLLLLTFSILQVSTRGRSRINGLLAFIYLCLACIWTYYGLYRASRFSWAPWLLDANIVITALPGPALYAYVRELTGSPLRSTGRIHAALPYLPALAVLAALLFLHPKIFVSRGPNPDDTGILALDQLNHAVDAYFLAYAAASAWFLARASARADVRNHRALYGILGFLVLLLLTFLILMIGSFLHREGLTAAGILLNGLNNIAFFFLSYRYPEFTQKRLPAQRAASCGKPPGPAPDAILKRVRKAVETDKAYRDPDITLQSLSQSLGLESHQVSRALNQGLGTNFRAYINAFRVKESKRLLSQKPEQAILDIGFSVGFNSKSSFNSVFLQATDLSPSEYRKRYAQSRKNVQKS